MFRMFDAPEPAAVAAVIASLKRVIAESNAWAGVIAVP